MSHERSLDALLLDILDDFETSLKTAKNGPARRRLAGRIERVKLAIEQRDERSALYDTQQTPPLASESSGLLHRVR
jgi:hypothetical protein